MPFFIININKNKKMEDVSFKGETKILFKKYKIKSKISKLDFNDVYLGKNILDNELVAIKVEKKNVRLPLLESEAFLLYSIKGLGIPKFITYGQTKSFRVLIMSLLGQNLEDIFRQNEKQFSLQEICLIAIQVLERIQLVHSHYFIHRNIKPDNFVIGKEDPNIIYLVDFGLSKKYRSSKTKKHIKFNYTGKLIGTLRFSSANALRGGEQSRKDDLISIGYMIIYFLMKKLPWQFIKEKNETERYVKIYKMKREITNEVLCRFLPKEMLDYMRYVQRLGFEENPDYKYLKNLFKSILYRLNPNHGQFIFSWINKENFNQIKDNINPYLKMNDFRKRIFKKFKEDIINNNARDSNSLDKSSLSAAPMALNICNNFRIIKNNSDDDLHLPAPNPIDTNLKQKNNFDIKMVNFENNKIINQSIDDFYYKEEQNNSQDINIKLIKDGNINNFDEFDNDLQINK